MKKRYILLFILVQVTALLLSIHVVAQDLVDIGKQKALTLSGGLHVRTIFYRRMA
jgi:hypothetical protein